jgi:hypothetical protein
LDGWELRRQPSRTVDRAAEDAAGGEMSTHRGRK